MKVTSKESISAILMLIIIGVMISMWGVFVYWASVIHWSVALLLALLGIGSGCAALLCYINE